METEKVDGGVKSKVAELAASVGAVAPKNRGGRPRLNVPRLDDGLESHLLMLSFVIEAARKKRDYSAMNRAVELHAELSGITKDAVEISAKQLEIDENIRVMAAKLSASDFLLGGGCEKCPYKQRFEKGE